MAYRVVYSANAQTEVNVILNYLLEEWNSAVANNFSEYLIATVDMLTQQPYAGKKHELISAIREFRVKPHYLVYYGILETEQIIHILNIVDSRRKK